MCSPIRVPFIGGDVDDERERVGKNMDRPMAILESAEVSGYTWLPTSLVPFPAPAIESAPDDVVVLTGPASVLPSAAQISARFSELAVLKADFTAMVAHELTSPIAAIRTLVAMLATGELSPEEQCQALATIAAQTDLLKILVADLESAATAERDDFAVRLRPVWISELLATAAEFSRTLPGERPMTTEIAGPDWVLADPERIGQVLRNLIENAAKYSPVGAPIELSATSQGRRMRIAVADRGPGIPPHAQRRIFEKFERGRDERGERVPGLGLGLYLSRRLVQMHDSELTVEPRPGGGSTFTFELELVW
ncbi:MAG: histidine kinase [Thermomicrobiales bacterium]|nr:histidine kinase [Thermomicrobiales bacterium]